MDYFHKYRNFGMKKLALQYSKTLATLLLIASLGVVGCQQNNEKPANETDTLQTTPPATVDTTSKIEAAKDSIPDLKGTWTGKFDQRSTTLKITEQDSTKFKGKITINYREVINQEVSGTIDPKSNEVKMKDLLHSRYQGKYDGKLSEDKMKLSGTFTMDLDGKKFPFSLTKK